MMLPTGTVTFLFTDIEGSTRLWESYPVPMREALYRHDSIIRDAVESSGGVVFRTVGDAFCCAFAVPTDALSAAIAAQIALQKEPWSPDVPIRVRMSIHVGVVEQERNDYVGAPLNRIARLLATAHGGQTVVSQAVYELVRDHLPDGIDLLPLGEHRLKDLLRPETVYQPTHPDLQTTFPLLRSLGSPGLANNLPQQTTSFVGREKEIVESRSLLANARLLTMTGSGGTGKTRLSLQVAADVLDDYPDGVWFVELAPLVDAGLVPQAVAQVLGVKEEPNRSLTQTLCDFLKTKRLLLVLDNCEHLLQACTWLVDSLLRASPDLKVLASSREALGVEGEQTYRVPSLSLPDRKQNDTPEQLGQYEAVRLFIERARLVLPDFSVTNENAPYVAQICYQLDGIPLALELAAARVRSLSVEEIGARLDNRFRLLTGGSRMALPRQQTLRALIDWSYDLLNDQEKVLLHRLSVFSGGWTLEAAEQVCRGAAPSGESIEDWEVLDLLTAMVDKSLVLAEIRQKTTRYRLLETVREYARDRLRESGEEGTARVRHRDYYIHLAEQAIPRLSGADQRDYLDRLEIEHDNFRAALLKNGTTEAQAQGRMRLAAALWRFWDVRGHLSEGRQQYMDALSDEAAQEPTKVRADALQGIGALARHQSDYAAADRLFQECVAIRRLLGDDLGVAMALNNLGANAYDKGEYVAARAYFEESLTLRRRLGNKRSTAATLLNLGNLLHDLEDYPEARALYEESLGLFRETGDLGNVAIALTNLGNLAKNQGDLATARPLYEESLAIAREIDDRWSTTLALVNLGPLLCLLGEFDLSRSTLSECLTLCREMDLKRLTAFGLEAYAELAAATSQAEKGITLLGAAAVLRDTIGSPLPATDQAQVNKTLERLRADTGEESFAAAWERGQSMDRDQAVAYALDEPRAG